jgi:RHS repeat-associated protein
MVRSHSQEIGSGFVAARGFPFAADPRLGENSRRGPEGENPTPTPNFAAPKSQTTQRDSWHLSGRTASGPSVYLYDGGSIIQETDLTGSVVARYADNPQNADEPLSEVSGSSTDYYEQDGLGSVTSLSSAAGSRANSYTYDSFGNPIALTGMLVNAFRYTARELDAETDIYFNRARYYDPVAGRFISEDPIRTRGGLNFYAYTGNSPVGWVDPYGFAPGWWNNLVNWWNPPPPAPLPSTPAGPALVYTNMNNGNPGGSTTCYCNGNPPLTIPTYTHPDSTSEPGAGDPFFSIVVGVNYGGDRPAYGPNGADIDVGDGLRYRNIHGGGSSLSNPYDPFQPLTPTHGCTRGHNRDVIDLGIDITTFQNSNPGTPVIYWRR